MRQFIRRNQMRAFKDAKVRMKSMWFDILKPGRRREVKTLNNLLEAGHGCALLVLHEFLVDHLKYRKKDSLVHIRTALAWHLVRDTVFLLRAAQIPYRVVVGKDKDTIEIKVGRGGELGLISFQRIYEVVPTPRTAWQDFWHRFPRGREVRDMHPQSCTSHFRRPGPEIRVWTDDPILRKAPNEILRVAQDPIFRELPGSHGLMIYDAYRI